MCPHRIVLICYSTARALFSIRFTVDFYATHLHIFHAFACFFFSFTLFFAILLHLTRTILLCDDDDDDAFESSVVTT